MKEFRLAIFASGSGSNAVAICEYFKNHKSIEIVSILSNNQHAGVLEHAKRYHINTLVFNKADFTVDGRVHNFLREQAITHIVLAGFLWLVPSYLVKAFPNKIINIHPALLPKHGGKGMYGARVHEAVKQAGDEQSGITIHLVNEHFDEGAPLFQATCSIESTDTADEIAKKVQLLEHTHYPQVIERWILG